jgi:hypothetical protein
MFDPRSFLSTGCLSQGRTLTAAALFRGKDCSTAAVEKGLSKYLEKNSS